MQTNNSQNRDQHDLDNGSQSFINLTSQPQPQQQNNNPPSTAQVSNARQRSRLKYQLMRRQNQQYKRYFKQYLQKQLSCTISQQLMSDPVLISSGFTFDRMNITDWIRAQQMTQEKKCPTCPQTRQPITRVLKPNHSIKKIIADYRQMLKRVSKINREVGQESGNNNQNGQNKSRRILISQYEKKNPHLTIDKNKHLLDHSCRPVIMKYFVRVNWRFFQTINLYQCDIDDQAIQMLLKHGQEHFKNVVELNLENNKITKIEGLERLPRLKVLYIGQNDKLTEQTRRYLRQINDNQPPNRRIRVRFQIQPL